MLLYPVLLLLATILPESNEKPMIIFANRKDIRIIDGGNRRGNTTVLIKDLESASALDIHFKLGIICWTDIEFGKIDCLQNGTEYNVANTAYAAEDLTIDWVSNNIYWSNFDENRIEVTGLKPPYYNKILIWKDIDQPRGIALAPHLGILFFTDWGDYPKIEKVGMNGEGRKVIVDKNIYWPNGATLDLINEELYWVDAGFHTISKVDFNGNNRKLIYKGTTHPFSIVFYNPDLLFYSDWGTNAIHSIKTDGTSLKTTSSSKSSLSPMDLCIYEEQIIPSPVWGNNSKIPCQNSPCSHLCLLKPVQPFFDCACPIGIRLLEDGHNCELQINEFIIVARGIQISRISLDTEDYTDVNIPLQNVKHILAVEYHVKSGFIFWTDDTVQKIRRVQMNGSNQKDVIWDDIGHPDGLAIDWVADNIYWTDAKYDRIEVSRLDGSNRKILISKGLQEPRALQVDPKRGFLFFSDWGPRKPRIERAYLDGSNREIIISKDIHWPNGLSVDIHLQKIYFCDANTDKIEMANYDGSGRKELVNKDLPHTFGFSLLGDYIYWTDWERRSIERVNKLTGKDRITIKEGLSDVMGLKVVSLKESNITNPCAINNGDCKHLCLYKPIGVICSCASGYELEKDNKTCTNPDAFLIYSSGGDLHRVSLNRSAHGDIIPVSKVKAATALDFDTVDNRIYFSDSKMKAISRAYFNGSETEKIIEFGIEHAEGISIDWITRNIYWTDFSKHRIEVAQLNGQYRRTLFWKDLVNPKAIVVHPSKGWLYYSMWKSTPTIERAALDGSKRSVFVPGVGRVNGLALDMEQNYIYFTDIDSMSIERVDLNGEKREVIVPASSNFKPSSIAEYKDYIYWADLNLNTIQKASKSLNSPSQSLSIAHNIFDMTIYHKYKMDGWDPCWSERNEYCSHLCFPIPDEVTNKTIAKCGCPTHFTLSSDGFTCHYPESFLLVSGASHTISRLVLDTEECPDSVIIGGQKSMGSITWNDYERIAYWTDIKSDNIKRSFENKTKQIRDPIIAFSNLFTNEEILKPFDIAFDPIRKLIFWSCSNFNSINITTEMGATLGSILSGGRERPQYLALDPFNSQLFFSTERTIERIRMDGMNRHVIASQVDSVGGLTFDIVDRQLYWTEKNLRIIETCDFEGRNRKTLIRNLDSPSAIAVLGRFVYWVEEKGGVERIDKWTGEERFQALPRKEKSIDIISVNSSSLKGTHPCTNSQCSYICLDSGCACPERLVLASDGRSCIPRLDCGAHEFACHSGSIGCISLRAKCNGIPDCFDESDEGLGCECDFACPCEGEVCGNQCLKKDSMCNGIEECIGGWDESSCYMPDDEDDSYSSSTLGTVITPIVIVIILLVAATIWYCFKAKSTNSNDDSSGDPLNPPTTLTTLNTGESLFLPHSSSTVSSHYRELLVPNPSPVTEVRSCCHHGGNYSGHHSGHSPSCSTSVCDNSTTYIYSPGIYGKYPPPIPPNPSPTSSPHSTIRSSYQPPPPSPT